MTPRFLPLMLLAVAAMALGAESQTIYRCAGNSYGQTPCPDGRRLGLHAGPDAADVADARRLADQDRLMAEAMQRSRWLEETRWKPIGAMGFDSRAMTPLLHPIVRQAARKKHRGAAAAAPREAATGPALTADAGAPRSRGLAP